MPPQCSKIYVLSAKGKVVETVTYGVGQNLRKLPPVKGKG
ncbi:hypothetical protein VDG1235_4324 [Verrucomicrobiia bacterium DG1235]|nr:hypothetical protein VDG1235_4324 [Verrucomicrobiae bacterium DG1235]